MKFNSLLTIASSGLIFLNLMVGFASASEELQTNRKDRVSQAEEEIGQTIGAKHTELERDRRYALRARRRREILAINESSGLIGYWKTEIQRYGKKYPSYLKLSRRDGGDGNFSVAWKYMDGTLIRGHSLDADDRDFSKEIHSKEKITWISNDEFILTTIENRYNPKIVGQQLRYKRLVSKY